MLTGVVAQRVDADAPALVELWADVLRRVDREEQVADVAPVIDRVSADARGAASWSPSTTARSPARSTSRRPPVSPINLEPVVQAVSPHVLPEFRRHGIGSALMEAAVTFAEELGIAHVGAAVVAGLPRRQPVHGPARARPGGDAAGRADADRRAG